MKTREIILLVFVPILLYLIYSSIETINKYEKNGKPISKSIKFFLIYLSILIPPLGFLITRKMK